MYKFQLAQLVKAIIKSELHKLKFFFFLKKKIQIWLLRPCLGFFFFPLITPYLIFITHHLSLKILKFPQPCLFGTHHSHFFDFCGTHTYNLVRLNLLAYPQTHLFLFSHFSFTPSPLLLSQNPNPNP